jgi:predicted CoA-binding protein
MKRLIGIIIVVVTLMLSVPAHAKRKEILRVPGGAAIPKYGLAIDASYDSRFDNFVPGYKVLQVALINNSFNIIPLNPQKDKWIVHTTEGKKKYNAIANLNQKDPRVWNALPERIRSLMAYPLALPIGARQVVDLFVPAEAPLETFRQVDVELKSMNVKLEVMARN